MEFIKAVVITVYMAVAGQTDSTPLITADGSKINFDDPQNWIAVSRDLLDEYPFGTKVEVTGTDIYDGIYEVRDVMNKRFTNRIDILIHVDDPIGKWRGTIQKID